MKKLIHSMMKKKVKELIRILGIGLNELVIEIKIGDVVFGSIEYIEESEQIILHKFEDELDYEFDFEDLDEEQQILVYKHLSIIYN